MVPPFVDLCQHRIVVWHHDNLLAHHSVPKDEKSLQYCSHLHSADVLVLLPFRQLPRCSTLLKIYPPAIQKCVYKKRWLRLMRNPSIKTLSSSHHPMLSLQSYDNGTCLTGSSSTQDQWALPTTGKDDAQPSVLGKTLQRSHVSMKPLPNLGHQIGEQ